MKNILTFVVFCLYSLSLMGQVSTLDSEQKPSVVAKSQMTFKLRLDSTIIVSYDRKGQIKSQNKYSYTYNSYYKLASLIMQEWKDGQFNYEMGNEYIYDSEGNISKQYAYSGNDYGTTYSEGEYICDLNGNIIESGSHSTLNGIVEYDHRTKTEHTYNEQGKETEYTNYGWDNEESEWKGDQKVKSIYDTDGREKQNLHYQCNELDCTWEKDGKTDYMYDNKGRKSEIIDYNWVEEEDILSLPQTITCWGDKQGDRNKTIQKVNETMIIPSGYQKYMKTEISYDDNSRNIQKVDYKWNVYSKEWLPDFKEEMHFDELHDNSLILHPYTPSNDKKTKKNHYKWNDSDSTWQLSSKAIYYYSGVVEQDKFPPSDIIVSPNPAEDFVTFNVGNIGESFYVKLYDMQGKLLITRKLYAHNQLSISHLSSSTYFYQLHHDNQIHTGKIIVK